MNRKNALPLIFLVALAIITLAIKRCNAPTDKKTSATHKERSTRQHNTSAQAPNTTVRNQSNRDESVGLDRNTSNLFFTKHARCRMKCRQITQQEVKDILLRGKVNYNKSDLNDPKGATYAVEGVTDDQQNVRIIFAPKKKHLSVVTVIDLDEERICNCD
jgi:hypothetical protein